MNDVLFAERPARSAREQRALIDLSDLTVCVQEHFKLCWFGAVVQLARCALETFGPDFVAKELPFIAEYGDQLKRRGLVWSDPDAPSRWWASIEAWEAHAATHLPLRALRLSAHQGWQAVGAMLAAGLHDDDPRFGALFAALQGGKTGSPTVGFLNACWSDGSRGPVRQLQEWGLCEVSASAEGRQLWTVRVPEAVWDVISDGRSRVCGPGWTFDPLATAEVALVLPPAVEAALRAVPALSERGIGCVIVRGPRASGRTSVVRRLARELGRGMLTVSPGMRSNDDRWNAIGPLAAVFGALPVAEYDLAAGESVQVPALEKLAAPLAVVVGRGGALTGPGVERAVTIELATLERGLRCELIRRLVPDAASTLHEALAERHRQPAGRLVHLAQKAVARAALQARAVPEASDFRSSARALHAEEMGNLATALPEGGAWEDLAISSDAMSELRAVESRCRHRESLAGEGHRFAPNVGVRILLSGPSGTGKTLAVRVLGAALGRDVYRVDLSAIVNKYIGETEKNLDRVLSLAEELDVILLFDEGDAMFARRTAVNTSNDRYANLETNFLLQRLESYEGILCVTTNARERIDSAFQRRMDAVVEFRAPEVEERRRLWEIHLPHENSVGRPLLDRLAAQCALTGGQIRNATIHARLLALDDGGVVNDDLLATSVRREYRKLGMACPLRLL